MAYAVIERDTDFQSHFESILLNTARIENYIDKIPPEFFLKKRNEVWRVIFQGMSTLENITTALANLTNLEILEFRNVSLDQYYPYPPGSFFPTLTASRLLLLKLSSNGADRDLTKSESILLHFLIHNINLPALASLEVISGQRIRPRLDQPTLHTDHFNEVLQKQSVLLPTVLIQFLAKNAATLKDVKLERNTLDAFTQKSFGMVRSDQIPIQLTSIQFRVDTFGIGALLKLQTRLENLTCEDAGQEAVHMESSSVVNRNQDEIRAAVHSCIQNCATTLLSIKLSGLLPVSTENDSDARENDTTLKLSTFRNCINLRTLKVDISEIGSSAFTVDTDSFPNCVSTFVLKVDRVDPDELLLLSERIAGILSLRQLTVHSNSRYELRSNSLRHLLKGNESLRDIELENARLPDKLPSSKLQDWLAWERSPGGYYWACEIRPKGIFFEKWVNHVE